MSKGDNPDPSLLKGDNAKGDNCICAGRRLAKG